MPEATNKMFQHDGTAHVGPHKADNLWIAVGRPSCRSPASPAGFSCSSSSISVSRRARSSSSVAAWTCSCRSASFSPRSALHLRIHRLLHRFLHAFSHRALYQRFCRTKLAAVQALQSNISPPKIRFKMPITRWAEVGGSTGPRLRVLQQGRCPCLRCSPIDCPRSAHGDRRSPFSRPHLQSQMQLSSECCSAHRSRQPIRSHALGQTHGRRLCCLV